MGYDKMSESGICGVGLVWMLKHFHPDTQVVIHRGELWSY
jgi:hypothetical protein